MKTKLMAALLLCSFGAHAEINQSTHDFLFSDFGAINKHSLETHSLPKKVALTGLVIEGRKQGWIAADSLDYRTVLAKFGFITPDKVANAPADFKADFSEYPVGLTEKEIHIGLPIISVTGMNVNCSTCHTGRLYDAKGTPTNQVWMGLPNTSINLELYTRSVYNGFKAVSQDVKSSHKLMKQIFPDTGLEELATIKLFVYGTVKKRIGKLEQTVDQPLPFSNGGPGVTNGVAALKYTLNFMDRTQIQPEYGFTSIPSLGDRFFRSSLLYDGVYSPKDTPRFIAKDTWTANEESVLSTIAASFTIPTMGQSIGGVFKNVEQVKSVLHDMIGGYKAPAFPGEIDIVQAVRGSKVYSQECARCHGSYDWQGNKPKLVLFPNKLVPQQVMGTDAHRWQAVTPEFVRDFSATELSSIMNVASAGGYVAPLLNSLWATAPYLHNASVPTLWDLMHPEQRPEKFMVGGHSLDFKKMGLKLEFDAKTGISKYPKDVQPWSLPVVYDTQALGQSNKGHVSPFDRLNEAEKQDLLEYLKLL